MSDFNDDKNLLDMTYLVQHFTWNSKDVIVRLIFDLYSFTIIKFKIGQSNGGQR